MHVPAVLSVCFGMLSSYVLEVVVGLVVKKIMHTLTRAYFLFFVGLSNSFRYLQKGGQMAKKNSDVKIRCYG